MKAIKKLFCLLLVCTAVRSVAQEKSIAAIPLNLSANKTTNIIFSNSILSADRGSAEVLVQKAKGVNHILQVKAATMDMKETNLSVITADGKLTSFILYHNENEVSLNVDLTGKRQFVPPSLEDVDEPNEAIVEQHSALALESKRMYMNLSDRSFGMSASLEAINVHENQLYFRIRFDNKSNINYSIEQLRFYITDRKLARRTSFQENEIRPTFIKNEVQELKAGTVATVVFVLPKFTIPDKKFLRLQVFEKHGGRHVSITVRNRQIMSAKPL